MDPGEENRPRRELSILDSTSIIVGVVIGVGIYETAPTVAKGLPGPAWVMGLWLLGGLLSLCGALCYAELASAYPRQGGDYVYLNRAYGKWAGHLFGWAQMLIIRPGDIALMAFIFGGYATTLGGGFGWSRILNASVAIACLTAINIAGVRQGKWTQNILTGVKIIGLLAIVVTALLSGSPTSGSSQPSPFSQSGFELALILVLFTYGGWNEMAYVAAEVRDAGRNIVRALVLGTAGVTAIYLLVNAAFLFALGKEGMAASDSVAVDSIRKTLPDGAAVAVACLVYLSALGAMNGLIFTGSRISYAMGSDHAPFSRLGRWNPKAGTPIWALLFQGGVSMGIILVLGAFEETIIYTAPVVWLFFLATGASVFILRRKDPDTERPYRVWGYPVTPLIFCACCLFLIYSSVSYAISQEMVAPLVTAGIILLGLPIYFLGRGSRQR